MRNIAHKLLNALSLIPSILSGAQRVLNVFRDQKSLEEKSQVLYLSILSAMGHMLAYLQEKRVWKVLKATFKQQNFEAGLVEKIENITTARDDFNDECELCHKEALHKIGEDSARNGDAMATLKEILVTSGLEQRRSHRIIVEGLASVQQDFEILARGVWEMKEDIRRVALPITQLMELLRASPGIYENVLLMSMCQLSAERSSFTDQTCGQTNRLMSLPKHPTPE